MFVKGNSVINYLGNVKIISSHKTAFLCSRKCPTGIILDTYDWAIKMRYECRCVISGFHSKIERDVLKYLLKGRQPIIIVLARGMLTRLKPELTDAINQKRLLIIAPFDESVKRVTEETAYIRNKHMLDIADEVYIPYYTKGGLIEKSLRASKHHILE